MKRHKHLLLFVLIIALSGTAYSQNSIYIGKIKDVAATFKKKARAGANNIAEPQVVNQLLPGNKSLALKLNSSKQKGSADLFFGEVYNTPYSNFYLEIKGSEVSGYIVMRTQKKYYHYTSGSNGSVYLTEEDIDKFICTGIPEEQDSTTTSSIASGAIAAIPPSLESLPGAQAVVYLDFDGQNLINTLWNSVFNNGNPIKAAPANLSETEMVEVWKLVSEDYRPFQLNVTTSEAVFNNAPIDLRVRVIFTPTNYFYPNAGGVAYIGCFRWGGTRNGETPCWVFNPTGKYAGEAGSHEIGHTLSLLHDGRTSPAEAYFYGQESWAPIMGVGYYVPVVQWSKGEYPFANNTRDDLDMITSLNGFGYRPDDYGNDINSATPLVVDSNSNVLSVNHKGTISRQADADVFSFSTGGGKITLSVNPDPDYPNLDISLTLSDAANKIIATANPSTQGASLQVTLQAGTYYLTVDGTKGTLGADSDYGSLGEYSISGTIPANAGPTVSITSPANGAGFIAPAAIIISATAADDGNVTRVEFFSNTIKLGEDLIAPFEYTWKDVKAGTYSITAKATDNLGKTTTSASIVISVGANKAPTVTVTSPANNATYTTPAVIIINATASDQDGKIKLVQFYNNGVLLHTDSTSPFSHTVNNAVAGSHSFVAKAMDNNGLTNNSASVAVFVSIPTNKAPSVSITSPANNAKYIPKATITINADASDPGGSIAAVKFYSGSTLLKTDSTSPYNYTMNNAAAGNYKFYANATDNKGLASSSQTISVFVGSAQANKTPLVKLSAPANNTTYTAPANITLDALASDTDGTITRVQFYNGGTLLKTDSISPFSYTLNNASAGNYSFVAKATDNNGFTNNSASVAVAVSLPVNKAPVVNIASPGNNAVYYTPANIKLEAISSDADGSISNVKFFSGSTLLKTDSISAYSFTINNIKPGNYSFTAKSTDDKGLAGSSASVYVRVIENKAPVVSLNANYNAHTVPPTISLSAGASDTDGTINYVDFYNDTTLLSRDSTSPYRFTFTNVAAGNYSFTAKATDNRGLTTTSPVANVTFSPNSTFEAEDAFLNGAVANSSAVGYTGSGYADYTNALGDYIEWTVEASVAGPFVLKFRYANGGSANRPLQLQVNGVVVEASLDFLSTGGWSAWSVSSAISDLISGTNKIRLTAIGSNGANVDNLTIVANTGTLEAEDAVLKGAIIASAIPGFTGSGYADYINPAGDFIEWTINAATDGPYSLQFRYANGGTTNRYLQMEINGQVVNANLDFLPTGSWATWSVSAITSNLIAGINKIKLTTKGYNGPNIDNLSIKSNNSILSFQRRESTKTSLPAQLNILKAIVTPNPVTYNPKLILSTSSNLPVKLQIIDMLGRNLKTIKFLNNHSNNFDFSIKNLTPGSYVIIVMQGNVSTRVRFIVPKIN